LLAVRLLLLLIGTVESPSFPVRTPHTLPWRAPQMGPVSQLVLWQNLRPQGGQDEAEAFNGGADHRDAEAQISYGKGQNPRAPKGPPQEMDGAIIPCRI